METYICPIVHSVNVFSRLQDSVDGFVTENRLEGWLSVPKKQNIKRHGWTKQYVVVSSKKILFYNSENSKMNADPTRVLDIE